jgi:hypothetical protein
MTSASATSPRLLDRTFGPLPRVLLVVAALLLVAVFLFPLWSLTMFAPQYPDGLRLQIYSYKLDGGNAGQDVKEINVLNHYIGMRDLASADFNEFKWMPFVVGALALLFLRAMVHAHLGDLLDVVVLYLYFALYSLWSFGYKLYQYGHDLSPTAAVKVEPFMPPMFGFKQLANFGVYSYPGGASYCLAAAALALVAAGVLAWRQVNAERVAA